jgi:hypothetical protein
MITLLLPALAMSLARAQSASISFSCRAEPMSRLIVDLSKATGMHLTVSQTCANDVLLVSAQGVKTRDLLAEIAKVDAGKWKSTADGMIFSADLVARRTESRQEVGKQAALVETIIDQRLASASKKADPAKPGAEVDLSTVSDTLGQLPEMAAILKLLKGIDPSRLVIDNDQRVVFSSHPNEMQVPFGPGADQILEDLIKSHNERIEASKPKAAVGAEEAPSTLPASVQGLVERMTQKIVGYAKADLTLGTLPYVGGLMANLSLYDQNGKVILFEPYPLDFSGLQNLMAAAKPMKDPNKTPVELSPETKSLTKMLTTAAAAMGAGHFSVPPLLSPYVIDPEHHDPLALLPSDKLIALALAEKKPLVAVVPDDAMSLVGSMTTNNLTVESFEKELAEGKSMVMSEQNGWIEIKPVAPDKARSNRTDRSALGKLLRATKASGIPALDDIAEFAQDAPPPLNGGVCQLYLSLFVPGGSGQGMDGFTNWNMYRIYGQIAQDRRLALLSGSTVPINNLTLTQQNYLVQMVFGSLGQLQVGNEQGDTGIISQMMSLSMGGNDYKNEPTELLPSGIPGGGYFEMKADHEQFVSPVSATPDDSAIPQIMGADELAALKYFSQQPAFAKFAGMMPKYDKMKLGDRTVYHLTFHLTDNIKLTGTLKDSHMGSDAQIVSADNLPSDLQAQIAKKMEALKTSALAALTNLAAAPKKPPHP